MTLTPMQRKAKRAQWRQYYHKTFKHSEKRKAQKKIYYDIWRKRPEQQEKLKRYQTTYKTKHKLRVMVLRAIKRAERNGVPVDRDYLLSFRSAFPDNCECCGKAFIFGQDSRNHQPPNEAPTLDRIVTEKGYVTGNVAIICWRCNVLKKDGSLTEMQAIVDYMRRATV